MKEEAVKKQRGRRSCVVCKQDPSKISSKNQFSEQDLLLSASIEQDVSLDDKRFKASGKFSINIFKQKARFDRKIRARFKMSVSLFFFFLKIQMQREVGNLFFSPIERFLRLKKPQK